MAATSKDDDYDREGHRCRRCIFWLRGNFYDSFGSIGNGHHHLFCFFFVKRASELSTRHWAGSKLECVELCNFYFCCALIFCQPMKKFEFLGVSRATRQRHFKTSSTGDENDFGFAPGSFVNFYVQQDTEGAHLLDRLFSPESGQLQSLSPNNSVGEDADYCNS